jgi:hypothetical protein
MTEPEQQEEEMRGGLGDDAQFESLMRRTDELITQYFQLFCLKGGTNVFLYPGEEYFLSAPDL